MGQRLDKESVVLCPFFLLRPSTLQVQTLVERIEAYNYLPVVAGSSIGGLLLLTLMMVALYKVRRTPGGILRRGGGVNLGLTPQNLMVFVQRQQRQSVFL